MGAVFSQFKCAICKFAVKINLVWSACGAANFRSIETNWIIFHFRIINDLCTFLKSSSGFLFRGSHLSSHSFRVVINFLMSEISHTLSSNPFGIIFTVSHFTELLSFSFGLVCMLDIVCPLAHVNTYGGGPDLTCQFNLKRTKKYNHQHHLNNEQEKKKKELSTIRVTWIIKKSRYLNKS